jgi:hypothetical protein
MGSAKRAGTVEEGEIKGIITVLMRLFSLPLLTLTTKPHSSFYAHPLSLLLPVLLFESSSNG